MWFWDKFAWQRLRKQYKRFMHWPTPIVDMSDVYVYVLAISVGVFAFSFQRRIAFGDFQMFAT